MLKIKRKQWISKKNQQQPTFTVCVSFEKYTCKGHCPIRKGRKMEGKCSMKNETSSSLLCNVMIRLLHDTCQDEWNKIK